MSADEQILSLPPEPEVGTVVEYAGIFGRYVRVEAPSSECWRRVADTAKRPELWPWVTVWAAAAEEGHAQLRIVPPDPHPVPWIAMFKPVDEIVTIEDAAGATVCQVAGESLKARVAVAERIVNTVNKAGEQR